MKVEDQYVAVLNEEGLPQLRISPVYRRLLDKSANNSDETRPASRTSSGRRSGRSSRLSSGRRRFTRLRPASSTSSATSSTMESSICALVLRDVANDIGMHESTVSRVTNSYMHTPQGVFEMKLLPQRHQQCIWRGRLVGHDQAAHPQDHRAGRSAEAAERLEDRQHPAAEGLELARRTIAKYREELKIPTSNQRKASVCQHAPLYASRTDRTTRNDHAGNPKGCRTAARAHGTDAQDHIVSVQVVIGA